MKNPTALNLTFISSAFFNFGSVSWKPGWFQMKKPSQNGDVSELLKKANHMIQSADSREKVLKLIETYEKALKINPENREAMRGVAWYAMLLVTGYSKSIDEKKTYFFKIINCCEQIMYLNKKFASLVDKGKPCWVACRVLPTKDLEALFMWSMATGGIWKDCLSGLEKLINLNIGFRSKKMLKAMMEIDPTWGNGTPYYAWANYYAVSPRFAGGDLKKAAEYYKKAIELGPDMLNFRRTRALFLHTKNNDRKAFEEDLNWVLLQDPKRDRHYLSYPYSVFLQREAKELLNHIDEYF